MKMASMAAKLQAQLGRDLGRRQDAHLGRPGRAGARAGQAAAITTVLRDDAWALLGTPIRTR